MSRRAVSNSPSPKLSGDWLKEGSSYFSLGGSFGTRLEPHPNADPEVERLFATLRQEERARRVTAICKLKSKSRPATSALYLCRPARERRGELSEVLLTLAGEAGGAAAPGRSPGRSRGTAKPAGAREGGPSARRTPAHAPRNTLHPLLGERLQLAIRDVIFQSRHDVNSLPFLKDHEVGGVVVLPGTAYVEMGLAAATFGEGLYALADVSMQQAMVFTEGTARTIQLVLKEEDDGTATSNPQRNERRGAAARAMVITRDRKRARGARGLRRAAAPRIARRDVRALSASYRGRVLPRARTRGPDVRAELKASGTSGGARARRSRASRPRSLWRRGGVPRCTRPCFDACLQVFEIPAITVADGQPDDIYLLRGVEEVRVSGRHGRGACGLTPFCVRGTRRARACTQPAPV